MTLNLKKTVLRFFLCIAFFSVGDVHAAIVIKKHTPDETSSTHNSFSRLSEQLNEFRNNHKVSFFKKLSLIAHSYHGYNDGGGSNILSLMSMLSGIVAYCCLIGAAMGLLFSLSFGLAAIIACAGFSLLAIILGCLGLHRGRARGMAMAGIIEGGVLLTIIVVVGLFIVVAASQ